VDDKRAPQLAFDRSPRGRVGRPTVQLGAPSLAAITWATKSLNHQPPRPCSRRAPQLASAAGFDPAGLALPPSFETYGDDFEIPELISAEWTAIREGEPTEDNCPRGGEGYLWTWTDSPRGGLGDPDINLFACVAASPEEARQALAATQLENTVLVVTSNPAYVSTEDLGLAADESKLACVRLTGEVQACSAWSYLARYGRYLYTVTFESKLTWDHLSEDEFVRLATEVDAHISGARGQD